ncbi:hypothetical protein PUNSTDRAFT_44215 [Punctularia strigosozonata HHB-11173 SS5]|uniref:uncharacterized protein n=1 Tax=Punctularia strigosozonata (strain HHB-11173) TaxID=741275 RepID=UPI00044183E7|nr:uncharacterized protein PUNSTDRAFT_44215 [Punctularia strigosozonata HHB-11173 SS5]EIN10038.1 hypothetical protein PUNSTDRAFT_44215 [Punctularia strigosozonata HHB-11173 SS5]
MPDPPGHHPAEEVQATFTCGGQVCQCCFVRFQPGKTTFTTVLSSRSSRSGEAFRICCVACTEYYRMKAAATRLFIKMSLQLSEGKVTGTPIGYTPAHGQLGSQLAIYQSHASGLSETFNASVLMGRIVCSGSSQKLENIGDIGIGVPAIPARIGLAELKQCLFHALAPRYNKWSENYPLELDAINVHYKKQITPLLPMSPDINIVWRFLVKKGGGKNAVESFQPDTELPLWLVVEEEMYDRIIGHISQTQSTSEASYDDQAQTERHKMSGRISPTLTYMSPSQEPIQSLTDSSRAKSTERTLTTTRSPPGSPPATPPPSKRLMTAELFTSPSRYKDRLDAALSAQMRLDPVQLRDICNSMLLQYCKELEGTLVVDIANQIGDGSFKTAHKAEVSVRTGSLPQLLHGTVCAKQVYVVLDKKQRHRLDGMKELRECYGELNNLAWGSALLHDVYAFMAREEQNLGPLPWDCPKMQFVEAMLAICQGPQEKIFLIKQWIPIEDGFYKYINNNVPIPDTFADEDLNTRAEFLSFSQHVQWVKSGQKVFVSDLQGGRDLLTDPQIMTHP